MGKLIIFLVVAVTVAYGQEFGSYVNDEEYYDEEYRSCPFWKCGTDLYGIKDYNTCIQRVEEKEQCIQDALKEVDICETCETWDFDSYTATGRGAYFKRKCRARTCEMDKLGRCFMPAQSLLMFYDTSVVDEIISCIDGWNPVSGRAQCLNDMNLPGYIDPIEAVKEVLTEVKAGCDPVVSVVKCRGELKPLGPLLMGPRPRGNTTNDIVKAGEGLLTCVQKELKNYPCKKLSTILPGARSSIVNYIKNWFTVDRPPIVAGSYDKYCQKSQAGNSKFARFAGFFHQKK